MTVLLRLLIGLCLICFNLSFIITSSKFSHSISCKSKVQSEEEVNDKELRYIENTDEDLNDPYGELLDFNTPMEQNELISTWSIDGDKSLGLNNDNLSMDNVKLLFRPKKDTSIDMAGLAPLDEKDDEDWLKDARDVIELQRGYAIWSKRSDVEIQREIRKAAASKALNMPESVARIVRLVHLERTHKLGQLKKERDYELGCIEYRKWLSEQRKRTKKDPIPIAKVEVSKRWMTEHPAVTGTPPSVVMDERTGPVYGVTMDPAGKGGGGAMTTFSMTHWNSTAADLQLGGPGAGNSDRVHNAKADPAGLAAVQPLMIDDHEMFVVTDDEYFVVL